MPMSAFTWSGPVAARDVLNLGPLALIQPLLDQLDVEAIIDRHLPPDPQQEFSHGQVLRLLLMARLSQPTALVNVGQWAAKTGADILSNIPVDKINDDRLARSLDAFFDQRHSILGSVTAKALQVTGLSLERMHFDPTHLPLSGAYSTSRPRPTPAPGQALQGDARLAPAHIAHGYATTDTQLIQAGQLAIVDDLGAVPVFLHCVDGNHNNHTAIHQTLDLAFDHLDWPENVLLISDRGTCSIDHIARLHRDDHQVVCAANWKDYRGLYDAHADTLCWEKASFLSVEQRRRRRTHSKLPHEHYEIAVLRHTLVDPDSREEIPARLIFAYSSADERECRQRRSDNIAKITAGLERLQAKVLRGHPQCTATSITRQITELLGKREAASYFTYRLVPLSAEEQAALPPPGRGCCRATQRLEFHFDAAAAEASTRYDGLSVLVTTAAQRHSGDHLFRMYKQQNYVELLHHQWKTPLAVTPIFLKTPQRIEALVCLLQLALQAYQVLERRYRQSVVADESEPQQPMTSEQLLRIFQVYGLLSHHGPYGRVVHATRLSNRQRQVLDRLNFPTPMQTIDRLLMPEPTG
jgi:hypothetical protein